MERSDALAEDLRAPASAGVAGVLFAGILIAVLALMHSSVPSMGSGAQWLANPSRRQAVSTALTLIPFAGISFLWFIGVVRTRLGAREDKLFATVFLGSGLLFVALLFCSSAVLGSLLVMFDRGVPVSADSMLLLQVLTKQLMGAYGARMAAVFTLSVTSVGARTGILPRWLVVLGVASALALFATPPLSPWAQLVFPGWVLVLSVQILVVSRRR